MKQKGVKQAASHVLTPGTAAGAPQAATMRCDEAAPAGVPAGVGRAALPTGMSV